ncbi:hypothetical protein S40288_10673 [Stachybotrys chartarum IBT 40288]|nr:hypothetical protein S40288_10673 [Stachybotrys chartarum IBT 40288]
MRPNSQVLGGVFFLVGLWVSLLDQNFEPPGTLSGRQSGAIQTDEDSLALAAAVLPVLSETLFEFWAVDPTAGAEEMLPRPFCMISASLAFASFDAADLASHRYLLMGRVSVAMQAVDGDGILTLVSLDSDTEPPIHAASHDQPSSITLFKGIVPLIASQTGTFSTYTVSWIHNLLVLSLDKYVHHVIQHEKIPWTETPTEVKLAVRATTWPNKATDDAGKEMQEQSHGENKRVATAVYKNAASPFALVVVVAWLLWIDFRT